MGELPVLVRTGFPQGEPGALSIQNRTLITCVQVLARLKTFYKQIKNTGPQNPEQVFVLAVTMFSIWVCPCFDVACHFCRLNICRRNPGSAPTTLHLSEKVFLLCQTDSRKQQTFVFHGAFSFCAENCDLLPRGIDLRTQFPDTQERKNWVKLPASVPESTCVKTASDEFSSSQQS